MKNLYLISTFNKLVFILNLEKVSPDDINKGINLFSSTSEYTLYLLI